jgi:hypothetical protein
VLLKQPKALIFSVFCSQPKYIVISVNKKNKLRNYKLPSQKIALSLFPGFKIPTHPRALPLIFNPITDILLLPVFEVRCPFIRFLPTIKLPAIILLTRAIILSTGTFKYPIHSLTYGMFFACLMPSDTFALHDTLYKFASVLHLLVRIIQFPVPVIFV